jgi:hypothetical protein
MQAAGAASQAATNLQGIQQTPRSRASSSTESLVISAGSGPAIDPALDHRVVMAAPQHAPSAPSDASAIQAFTDAKKPSPGAMVATGALGAVAVPLNLATGAFTGIFKGAHYGGKIGNKLIPIVGAFIGALTIGPVVGAAVQAVKDVGTGLTHTRRLTGRYAFVNAGLSIKTDSVETLRHILSSIPEDRVSQDATGHTIVTVKREDQPFLEEGSLSATLGGLQSWIDSLGGRYDAQGNRPIDVNALLASLQERGSGLMGHMVAIKARNLGAPESPVPELCRSATDDRRTSVYIQSNIQNPQRAGLAGLQFLDVLDRIVNHN